MPHRSRRSLAGRLVAAAAVAVAALAALAMAPPAAAQDSMARLAATGRIVLGGHDGAVPVSYGSPAGDNVGFHMDICERIVAALRQRANLPALKSVVVPVTMSTRLAMLNNGTVDMDCGPNPINAGTTRQALLAHATLASDIVLMTTVERRGYGIADLDGKTVAMVVGGISALRLRAVAREAGIHVTEVFARDGAEALAMLEGGRVDAIASPMPLLAAQRARSKDPDRLVMLDVVLGRTYSGIMFRLGDESLRSLANEVIVSLSRSGELKRLYDKWYVQTIPGIERPLALPLGGAQREIVEAPDLEQHKL